MICGLVSMRAKPSKSLGPLVVDWIERYCVHGPGDVLGAEVRLTTDEKRLLSWAYELDVRGVRVVRRTLVGLPKGSRKTEFAAWVALAECAGPVRFDKWDGDGMPVGRRQHDPYVVASASTYEQSDLLFAAARMIVTEGPLKQYFDVFDKEIQLKGEPGVLVRVPAVAGANDGLRPTFVVADETHEWTGSKARVHLVLENGLAKRQDSWSLSITTAGNPKVQSVALQQYEYGRKVLEGTIADPGFLMVWREPKVNVDELADVKVRAKALAFANPEPWKRLDDLERRFHEVPLHEFCRYHLNMWVEPDAERWLPPGVWDGLAAGGLPEDGTKIVLGFDGSYSGDSTALVGATVAEQPHLFVLGLWEHPGGSQGWQVDIDEVDATVLAAFSRFEVLEMSADPPYWAQQIQRWAELFGEDRVLAFNTFVRKRMAAAVSSFYQAATQDGLTHDGHEGLGRHVDNAVLKETAQGAYIVKEDKSSPRKIDAAIAAVIAYNRARWHYDNPVKPVSAGVMFV
jgi:phage terminase large subunit-like protein